jgi:hypothetical protein
MLASSVALSQGGAVLIARARLAATRTAISAIGAIPYLNTGHVENQMSKYTMAKKQQARVRLFQSRRLI